MFGQMDEKQVQLIIQVQKEYTEIINSLRDKLKSVQDKYKEEICINSKKDGEIAILTKRTDELSSKLKQIETEFFNCNNLLKQEREKCLTLENDFIKLQNESFSLEKKYSCVRILESERDKVINENHKLSNDCNELEIALEICHQKMRGYDDEINLYCKCLKQMEQDKKACEENEKIEKDLNNELQKRVESMNSTLKILQKKLDSKEELIRKNVENLIGHLSIHDEFKESHDDYFNESNIEDENYSKEFLQLRVLLSNFKKELEDCIAEKYRLEMKLQTTVSNMEKYREYIREANNMIKCLGKKLDDQEEIIKKINSRKDVEKCVQKIGNTNAELQKHIHSQEELHKNNVDEYGFRRPDDFDYQQYEKFMSTYFIILTNRSKKWYSLINDEKRLKKGPQLKRYVRKGIPSTYRSKVWAKISGVEDVDVKSRNELFNKSLNTILDSEVVQAIRLDLPRTFPDNIYFIPSEGFQEQLYRILFAFAADNKEVGYCQGLNYVAGLLLLNTKDEEATFWLLKVLVDRILPGYYTPKMKDLMIDIEVFDRIVKSKMPELYKHIKSLNIPWSCLIMKWFICLYAEVLPTETVLRVWDCVFYEGCKVLFRVGITLLNHNEKTLLECSNFTSFTDSFKKMQSDIFVLDCHTFMKKVNSENKFITNRLLQKLRKQVKSEKK
ncbi:TBC1 domain family member 2A-like isoform X2 [Planococcus citri]|uniref:TBC1 domain family member 2A-like isoform X2 n=1 Tax=Planococcus citri TaxID=170843 RepID=UPI0031F80F13